MKLKGDIVAALVIFSVMGICAGCGLFLYALPNFQKSSALLVDGVPTEAQVLSVSGSSRQVIRYAGYSYVVGGSKYQGMSPYPGLYGSTKEATVYYLPTDPAFSAVNPRLQRDSARRSLIVMSIWLTLLILFGSLFIYQRRRMSLSRFD